MTVTSTFWYLKNLPLYETTKPYVVNLPLSHVPAGQRTNQDCHAYSGIQVRDIRAAEETPTLDRNGFELSRSVPLSLEYEEFRDPAKVREVYLENVKTALLELTGAEYANSLHLAVGISSSSDDTLDLISNVWHYDRSGTATPASPKSHGGTARSRRINLFKASIVAYNSLREAFGDERANEIWHERRVEIIQVWRPIRGPVVDWPLGVCESASVNKDADLVPTDNVWSYSVSETYNVFHNPGHIWYYVSNQTPEDVLLFKGFDNAEGVSTFCPHAAFKLDTADDITQMRESVECAVLLVYPK
ncbi:hypothetical protein F4775DRAFT_607624 [Biscogniauxia sp. FL1348]|nr:hypothetical protein F4775DRAFT_607624 [Biscogniauxia sp. FL1348]